MERGEGREAAATGVRVRSGLGTAFHSWSSKPVYADTPGLYPCSITTQLHYNQGRRWLRFRLRLRFGLRLSFRSRLRLRSRVKSIFPSVRCRVRSRITIRSRLRLS